MRYCTLDLETSGQKSFGRFCNPLDKRNVITSICLITDEGKVHTKYNSSEIDRNCKLNLLQFDIIIGQNIKFDLLYLWENESLQAWIANGGKIWDTMLAEYLITGQQGIAHESLSLNSLSIKYGGTLKDSRVSDMYKAGLMSNEIPKDMLLEYNIADVENTALIFSHQYKHCRRLGMLPLMEVYMQHLLAVTEIEYNGMYVARDVANVSQSEIEARLAKNEEELLANVATLWPQNVAPFKLDSARHWSLLLFGGELAGFEYIDTGEVFKTGKRAGEIKTKKTVVQHQIAGLFLPKEEWRTKHEGIYSVDYEVLVDLLRQKSDHSRLINLLLDYRSDFKLLSTYYYKVKVLASGREGTPTGILTKVHPVTSTLHSEFSQVRTETGRLASSNPNAQNLPAEILGMFKSRFPNGKIIEFDYSQLEVVVQAYLAQSDRMIQDLKNGIDFHRLRLGYALDKSYEDVVDVPDYAKKRKEIAKPISFQKAYGAMPQTVTNRTGIPLDIVEKVFNKEDETYPEIKRFYELVQQEIRNTRVLTDKPLEIRDKIHQTTFNRFGEYTAYGTYKSLTGKIYHFTEKAVKTKQGDIWRYWQMPEIQNYPVQGLAADIVAMQVGEVFRFLLHHRDKCVMMNEIHDSLVLDCAEGFDEWAIKEVKTILSAVADNFQKYFGIKFNAPIKVDVKPGHSWAQCKE